MSHIEDSPELLSALLFFRSQIRVGVDWHYHVMRLSRVVYVATHNKWRKMAVSSNPFAFLLLLVVALSGIETVGGLGADTQILNHTLTHCVSSRSVSGP